MRQSKYPSLSRQLYLSNFIETLSKEDICYLLEKLSKDRKNTTSKFTIDKLPDELLVKIFEFLSTPEVLAACSQTCKRWRCILNDNLLWKEVCKQNQYIPLKNQRRIVIRNFNLKDRLALSSRVSLVPWKDTYIDNYLIHRNWQTGNYKVTTLTNSNETGFICMHFDHKQALSIKNGQPGIFWDLHTGDMKLKLEDPDQITAVKFDEVHIVSGFATGTIKVWAIANGEWTRTLIGHQKEVGILSLFGSKLASGAEDQTIRVWDIETSQCLHLFEGHTGAICALQLSKTHVVSGSTDSTVKMWSLESDSCIRTLHGHNGTVFCLQFDSRFLCTGSSDSTVIVWDFETGKKLKTLKGHHHAVVCLQFDGLKLVTGSADKTIKVWDLKTGYCLYSLLQHTGSIWNLTFNASQIISSSFDTSVLVWDFGCQNNNIQVN